MWVQNVMLNVSKTRETHKYLALREFCPLIMQKIELFVSSLSLFLKKTNRGKYKFDWNTDGFPLINRIFNFTSAQQFHLAKDNQMFSHNFSIHLNSHEFGVILECYIILPGICTGDLRHSSLTFSSNIAADQPIAFPASLHFISMVCRIG